MKLMTKEQRGQMIGNGRVNAAHIARDGNTEDFEPVVKLFCPWTAATWLLSELDPEDPDLAFGLCCTQHKPNYADGAVMLSVPSKLLSSLKNPGHHST